MTTLHDRLADLAEDAPPGGPVPHLWSAGVRRHRRVRAVSVLATIVVAGRCGRSDRRPPGAGGPGAVAGPSAVRRAAPAAHGVPAEPVGRRHRRLGCARAAGLREHRRAVEPGRHHGPPGGHAAVRDLRRRRVRRVPRPARSRARRPVLRRRHPVHPTRPWAPCARATSTTTRSSGSRCTTRSPVGPGCWTTRATRSSWGWTTRTSGSSGDSRYLETNYSLTGSNRSRQDSLVVWDVDTGASQVAEPAGHYWRPVHGSAPSGIVLVACAARPSPTTRRRRTRRRCAPKRKLVGASYGPRRPGVRHDRERAEARGRLRLPRRPGARRSPAGVAGMEQPTSCSVGATHSTSWSGRVAHRRGGRGRHRHRRGRGPAGRRPPVAR